MNDPCDNKSSSVEFRANNEGQSSTLIGIFIVCKKQQQQNMLAWGILMSDTTLNVYLYISHLHFAALYLKIFLLNLSMLCVGQLGIST